VRSFAVQVTDQLPLRSSIDIAPDNAFKNALAGPLKAGDTVYLLVPAAVCTGAVLASASLDDAAHTPVALHPDIKTITDLPDATKAFLGDGVAYEIHLLPGEVPGGPGDAPLRGPHVAANGRRDLHGAGRPGRHAARDHRSGPLRVPWPLGATPPSDANLFVSSGRPDLNRRPPRPKRGALPG
jgi:hypothetical protein